MKNKDNTIQLPVKTIAVTVMFLLAVFLLIPGTVMAEGGFAGGSGTVGDPWLIETPEQLATVAEEVYRDGHFKLIDDIDLSEYLSEEGDGWNEGAGWKPIGTEANPFTGSFDGGEEGYTINGLYINRSGTDYVGMFGYTGDSAEICNLRLENVDVIGYGYVGSMVGYNEGIIEDSYVTGGLEGIYYVGGMAGFCETTSNISDCYTMINVFGEDDAGGLTGMNLGTIEDSCASGIVWGHESVGGLSGSSGGIITDSYAVGDVSSIEESANVGGLVGYSWGTIENSYATGEVCGITYVGGLVGSNGGVNEGIIENSYATGAVEGDEYVGGLVGANCNSSTVFNSYAVGAVIGDDFFGGLVGENDLTSTITSSYYDKETTCQEQGVGTGEGSGVTDLTTAEMKHQDSFEGWDFSDTWNIAGGTYPYLKWQINNLDYAPPVFTVDYPKTENITYEGMDILVQVDEDAAAYYVVLADGVGAPDAAQIKAGKDSENTDLAENLKGSIAGLSAGTDGSAAITGLAPGTEYDIYVVAEDTAGNMQPDGSVALLEACTGLMPTGNMGFALTIPDPEADGNSIAVNQSSPKSVDVNTVNGIGSVEITGTKTAAQSVAVGGADADKVTADGETTEPAYAIDTSAIAAAGGTYEFTLTVSEAGKADIVYNVTVTVAVPDNTPPVPGNGGTITVSNITQNSLELSWAAAADGVTAQQNLQYKVVRSESNNIDTVINVEANGTIVKDWTAGLTSTEASGLSAETIYYFNVIVRDEAGNKAAYTMKSQTTAAVGESFTGGTGDPGTPYQVASPLQLNNIKNYMDKHFILTADIDLSAYGEGYDGGKGWKPVGTYDDPFTGSFDGNGYVIEKLFINRPEESYLGIFGCTGEDAVLSNLRLLDVDVVGDGCVGALVGANQGIITGSCTAGSVEGDSYVGGLVGLNWEATGNIIDCYSAVNVIGIDSVGSLAGGNEGTITGSYATGDVVGEDYIGGLTGSSGTIHCRCAITDSYATGNVTGTYNVGGLTGQNFNCNIENSYAAGSVTGSNNVGGLVGINEADGTVTSSYYDTETTGQTDEGKGEPKTTAEMKQQDSFVDWDFTNTWSIAGGTYPYLKWQINNLDYAPPVFTVDYPKTENITYEGMDILVQVDEDAAAYYVVLADGVGAPDAAQIKAGKDSENTDLAENLKGSITELSAGTDGRAAITGLASGTEYDIYVVAEDTAGNIQPYGSVALLEACTGLMPTGNMNFALTTPDPEADGNSIAVDQSFPKSVDVNTVNGIGSVEITGTKTAAQSVAVGGADADKVTADGETTEPAYAIDTSAIAAAGGTYEFTLTVSEAGKADIVYNVTVTVAVPDNTPPVPGGGGAITVSNITHNSLKLSWEAASDGVTAQQNLQYKVVRSESNNIDTAINAEANGTVVKDWTAGLTSTEASGLSAKTIYYFNVIVRDDAGNKAVYTMKSQTAGSVPEREEKDDRRERNISGAPPVYNAVIKGSNTSGTTITVNVNTRTGSAAVSLGEQFEDVSNGEEVSVITIPSIPGVNAYTVGISADSLSGSQSKDILTFSTPEGSITLPGNMLAGIAQTGSKGAGITIGEGDKSLLPDDVKAALGDRPLVQLSLTLDGKQAEWNNPDASVTVSIPYKPTAEELADPEHITVWYIDGSGNVVSVPNGRYDPASGSVIFTTTHFSHYAVAYVTKSFNDLGSAAWAKKQVEVLASKGILKGISETEYAPQEKITRADFLYYLVRALGVDAKVDGNFGDISREAYYYKEIAVARKLEITDGTGNNKFNPEASITRQDMMVLTERALRMLKKLVVQGSASELDKFSDKSLVADYALDGVASIVKEGLIIGSGGRINPLGSTTRAEAAVFLYRIYNRY